MKKIYLLFGIIVFSFSLIIYAQNEQDLDAAREHFNNGVNFFDNNNYQQALDEFQRSYVISHSWRILFNIGQCLKSLNRNSEALTIFELYLREGGTEIDQEHRTSSEEAVAELNQKVGILRINVNVEGASIIIDNKASGTTPMQEIRIDRGSHTIQIMKQGYNEVEQSVNIDAQPVVLNITLERIVNVVPSENPPSQTTPEESDETPFYKTWWFWTAIGVVVVGTGVATTLAITKPFEEDCDDLGASMCLTYSVDN